MNRKQIAGMNQNYRQYSYAYFLDSMRMAGYESVELWLGAPHIWVDSRRYEIAKKILRETKAAGLKIVSVTAPGGGAFQYQYASQEDFHRRRSIAYFINGIRMAAELEAPIMTANCGWGYWNEPEEIAFERTVETLGCVCEEARKEGIVVALESLTKDETHNGFSIDQIEQVFKAVNSQALRLMVDLSAIAYSGETSQKWFDRFGELLIHYHFQDGDLSVPSAGHYAWGNGEFPLEQEIECLVRNNYSGVLTQEICGSADPRNDDIRNMQVLSGFFDE